MNKLYRLLGIVFSSLLFFQCQRNLDYIGDPDPTVSLPDPITASIQGNILDENNLPASGVSITIGSKTATTNTTGYFRIADAALDKNASLVTAEKPGYFKGYRVFSATSGTNQVVIKLVRRTLAGTVLATSGGGVNLTNGASITLPANGVVDALTGAAYTGDVKVYAAYIDPTSADIGETVPGSFMANDATGKRVVLASYGMLAVELESSAGNKLQIKSDATATLKSPIPASLQAFATSTIPMWYVDDKTGLWQEEGTASKQGNDFVASVKHFSNWNYDYRFEAVSLSFTLRNAEGAPLANIKARVTSGEGGGSGHGHTDSAGQIKGLVPANKNLLLEIFDPCGKAVYTQNIAPLSQATDLGTIIIPSSNPSVITFKGKVTDCSGAAVKTGYAVISFNNIVRYAPTNANGEYSATFLTCSASGASASVIGVDDNAQQQSGPSTVAITAPVTTAGGITACGTSSVQFINYQIDGASYAISSTANDSIMVFSALPGNVNMMGMQRLTPANYISMVVRNVTAAGVYPLGEVAVQSYRRTVIKTPFNVTFTTFAKTAGEFYEGTMTGQFTADSLPTVHNLSGSFKLRKN